jgi:hypothetical protein
MKPLPNDPLAKARVAAQNVTTRISMPDYLEKKKKERSQAKEYSEFFEEATREFNLPILQRI